MDIHKDELWFALSFLHKPLRGWTVDWDHIDGATCEGRSCDEVCDHRGDNTYMGGILVKHVGSGLIWRLTGESTQPPDEMYQGRWPD
jgi:hypothetical protein